MAMTCEVSRCVAGSTGPARGGHVWCFAEACQQCTSRGIMAARAGMMQLIVG